MTLKKFGNPQELIMEAQLSENVLEYINSLPQDEKFKLYAFPISLMISTTCSTFIFMYYFPAIIFSNVKNMFIKAFVALKDAFCFLFKRFFQSLLIFIVLCIINMGVVFLKQILIQHVIFDILYIFYFIYFVSYIVMLLCNYYGKNNISNNRPDGVGENENGNIAGEEI